MKDSDDLDALVSELNAGAPRPPRADDQTRRLSAWLAQVVERSASDLLLVAGAPPSLRIDGVVVGLMEGPLGSEEVEEAVSPALPPHARRLYREAGIADGSFRMPELGRFRINLHHERGRGHPPPARRGAALRNARPAAAGRSADPALARPGAGRRTDRRRQDHDAC